MAYQYGMGNAVVDYYESDILWSGNVDFLAGLKQVPLTYYEAAEIDGASEWDKFIKITVPMISPVVLLNTVMGLISAFQIFNQPFIMTDGGPMKATYTYGMLIYNTGFCFSGLEKLQHNRGFFACY